MWQELLSFGRFHWEMVPDKCKGSDWSLGGAVCQAVAGAGKPEEGRDPPPLAVGLCFSELQLRHVPAAMQALPGLPQRPCE